MCMKLRELQVLLPKDKDSKDIAIYFQVGGEITTSIGSY